MENKYESAVASLLKLGGYKASPKNKKWMEHSIKVRAISLMAYSPNYSKEQAVNCIIQTTQEAFNIDEFKKYYDDNLS
ncbi:MULTISPECIES: hypothetical protein [Lactobacillus]|uniref:Uncharacterized protein n=1 Tax=Lactobacillus xujianguonis TaxID=2495899 RepID=A0A437SWC6_9LACO|nr:MULTISPECIES: hypothetical protein [Lactobacillus]RVU71238.1 hypothetical protein EJK17_03325 [Lactobacillus xujianguonis]